MIRPQHKPLQAVTKQEVPGSGPAGMMSRATPSDSAPPVAESTRTHSVFMGWLPWQAEVGMGQEASLAQTLLRGTVKTELCDSVISS